ncbi:BA75_02458T0 [Komagataella pastoris]|uniref:Anaphase-promoting complex subunit 5 n=1 Tax=Komagataella pastoris TaxID=4922 RepID=A0A1B2JD01_PICPA|nr:BA75_02458T0 [Komagataella pastoris]
MVEHNETVSKVLLLPALSTSKISVLCLISLFCSKKLPKPSIPPLLSIIVHVVDTSDTAHDDSTLSILPTLDSLLDDIGEAITQHYQLNPNLDLLLCAKDIKTVTSLLLDLLATIQTVDDLHQFMKDSKNLLVEKSRDVQNSPIKLLTTTSFLGKFVHNLIVSFEYLDFSQVSDFWVSFQEYKLDSKQKWKTKTNHKAEDNADFVFQEKLVELTGFSLDGFMTVTSFTEERRQKKSSERTLVISQLDISNLLDRQIHLLEAYGTPTPSSLRKVLTLMAKLENGTLPSMYYVQYLEHLKGNEYQGAFDSLHRYFDYMMSNKQQAFYHYALLSLATLHASFGSDKEALRAINEAILVARENKDLNCLNYLLTWLLNFLKDKPDLFDKDVTSSSKDQILHFLKLKTKENKNHSLHSISYQFQASKTILEGGPLQSILEDITRASYILMNLDFKGEDLTTFVRNCQLQLSYWMRVGVIPLAEVYISIALDACNAKHNVFDELSILMRKAYLLFFKGEVEEAFKILSSKQHQVSQDSSVFRTWNLRTMVLKLNLWLNKSRLRCSGILLSTMLAHLDTVNDTELKCEVLYYDALHQHLLGNNTEAISKVSSLLQELTKTNSHFNNYWFIKYKLLYADIFVKATNSSSRCMSILLNAIQLAHSSSLIPLVVEGSLILLNLLITLDPKENYDDALILLYQLKPICLRLEIAELTANAGFLLSQTLFIKLKTQVPSLRDTKQELNEILNELETGIIYYRKINKLQMLLKCFELEKELSLETGHADLLAHATDSIQKIKHRLREENQYGFV